MEDVPDDLSDLPIVAEATVLVVLLTVGEDDLLDLPYEEEDVLLEAALDSQ